MMAPSEAAIAAILLHARVVIPMHCNAFEMISQNRKFMEPVNRRTEAEVEIIKECQILDIQV